MGHPVESKLMSLTPAIMTLHLANEQFWGTLQLVKSVTPQEVRLKDVDLGKTQAVNSVYSEPGKNCTISTMED
jgi:hypothetical protein